MSEPFAVLSIDCPWKPRDSLPGERGAAWKYETIATADLCKLVLPPRAERCVLFLWRLASMPQDALDVVKAWGFEPVSEIVWIKLRACITCAATKRVDAWRFGGDVVFVPGADHVCPKCLGRGGTPNMGMGSYTRGAHETCLVCRPIKGRAPERLSASVKSYFEAPMLLDFDATLPTSRGHKGAIVHSAKPDEFFDIVESLYPGPRVELFSRRTRAGWSASYSDQVGALDEVTRVMREVWPARVREERLAKARKAAKK